MEVLDKHSEKEEKKKRNVSRTHFWFGLLSLIFNSLVFLAISITFFFIFTTGSGRLYDYGYNAEFYGQNFFLLASLLIGIVGNVLIIRGRRLGTTLYGLSNIVWIILQLRFILEDNRAYRLIFIAAPLIFMFFIFKSKRLRDLDLED
ncbi:MAG: hypothetical protein MK078_17390 [Crocinitomicaceae bacterium]|nr:hypothetical protein [Crocinitomicaceae bacterium]MCH2236017.1 hypothetical protein [Crocinitomicaceae bacterium]